MQSSITLPSSEAPAGDDSARHEPIVLIVDDYQDCRDMYAAYLSLAGFRVLKAQDGMEALAMARRWLPDVILMDLSLPGMDGCEATRRLKSDPATHHVPVVALTAQSLPETDELHQIGFHLVITKPCLPDQLAEEVGRVVARSGD